MAKTELKLDAQDRLMTGMRSAYSQYIEELERESEDAVDAGATIKTYSQIAEMQRQMDRVAKLFGYEAGGPYGC